MTLFRRPAARLVLASGAAALLVPAVPAMADEQVVTTTADSGGGSLRADSRGPSVTTTGTSSGSTCPAAA
jgi:hypothetical protein